MLYYRHSKGEQKRRTDMMYEIYEDLYEAYLEAKEEANKEEA